MLPEEGGDVPRHRDTNIHAKVISTQGEIKQLNARESQIPLNATGSIVFHLTKRLKKKNPKSKHKYKTGNALPVPASSTILYNFVLSFFLKKKR